MKTFRYMKHDYYRLEPIYNFIWLFHFLLFWTNLMIQFITLNCSKKLKSGDSLNSVVSIARA